MIWRQRAHTSCCQQAGRVPGSCALEWDRPWFKSWEYQVLGGCGATGTILHSWWEYKTVQPASKKTWQFVIKLNTHLTKTVFPLLGIYLREIKICLRKLLYKVLKSTLSTIASNWKGLNVYQSKQTNTCSTSIQWNNTQQWKGTIHGYIQSTDESPPSLKIICAKETQSKGWKKQNWGSKGDPRILIDTYHVYWLPRIFEHPCVS